MTSPEPITAKPVTLTAIPVFDERAAIVDGPALRGRVLYDMDAYDDETTANWLQEHTAVCSRTGDRYMQEWMTFTSDAEWVLTELIGGFSYADSWKASADR